MMKRFLLLFLILPLMNSCISDSKLEKTQLRVLSFNILGGRNVDGKRDVERLAKVIKALNPDIVAMQEVDKGTGRIQGRDITAELAKLTGMYHAYGKAMNYDGGEYGEALLSKYPIKKVKNYILPAEKNAEPRAALTVVVNLPGSDQEYLFIATHLDHLSKETNRLMQAREINRIARQTKMPYIIAGDLNAEPESETIKLLSKTFTFTPKALHLPTYNSDQPTVKIDWIGSDKSGNWKLKESFTADKLKGAPEDWLELLKVSSDHLPLLNVYEFDGK
ncbi:MAG: endonuclease/exonuclease/phosphatase family protein [Lentisphaeraceae bacterium]|nr:endonuclease/exonuclease/phosphatase family protein [Lentisphaeraceae bacterium]